MTRVESKLDKTRTVCKRQEIDKRFATKRKWARFTVDDGAVHFNACYGSDRQFK